jgi:hypothetical protein
MAFIVRINNSIIIDGTEFVKFYNNNRPNFHFNNIGNFLDPSSVEQDYLRYSGCNLNVKSTIFAGARPNELIKGYGMVTSSDTDCNLIYC